MKKFSFMVLLLLLILVLPGMGHADPAATHINLDGNELAIPKDAQVQIVNGSVMVPLRLVAEQLGYNVKWDNVTKTATIEQAGTLLKLAVNNTTAESAGRMVQLNNPPFLSGSTTLIPLRFVGEETGTAVGWDNVTKTVYLTSPAKEIVTEAATVSLEGNISDPSLSTPPENGADVNGAPGSAEASADFSTPATELTTLSFSDNRLIIGVNGNISPAVSTLTGKDRIIIDLPGIAFSRSFSESMFPGGSQSGKIDITDYPDVSTVRYSLFSSTPSAIRIVIDLNSAKPYNVINANDGFIVVDLNAVPVTDPPLTPVPAITPPSTITGKKLVVIDAGHGGKDPGGISVNKLKEKDFTLATALKIEALLTNEPGIDFVLTRSDDRYPTLQDRSKLANDLKADLFVSIHANSIPEGSKSNPSGTETYYTRKESLPFATIVHKYLVPATGLADRGVRQSNLHVTRETKMPAILLECGYLSNVNDEAQLYSEEFQQRVAESVVAGIKEYLGI